MTVYDPRLYVLVSSRLAFLSLYKLRVLASSAFLTHAITSMEVLTPQLISLGRCPFSTERVASQPTFWLSNRVQLIVKLEKIAKLHTIFPCPLEHRLPPIPEILQQRHHSSRQVKPRCWWRHCRLPLCSGLAFSPLMTLPASVQPNAGWLGSFSLPCLFLPHGVMLMRFLSL